MRDDIAEKLADKSEAGLIPRFIKAVNGGQVVDSNETLKEETQASYTPSENGVDNSDTVEYNGEETQYLYIHQKRAKYLAYNRVGMNNVVYIKSVLAKIYGNSRSGIVNEIAIAKDNKVYIVDSGKEDGVITMGVREIITISNDALRNDFVREKNNDALSKGTISDGLSQRFRREHAGGGQSNRRQKHREELSTYSEKSSNNESGVSDGDGDRGGVNGTQLAYTPTKAESEPSPREIISTMLDNVAESEREKSLLVKYRGYGHG